MKSTISRMAAVALTMCLGLSAGVANAGALTFNGWTASGGGYSTYFGNAVTSSPFTDWLDFTLPAGSSGSGSSNVISLNGGSSVTFSKFELWESAVMIATGATGATTSSLSFFGGAVPGAYKLKIEGTKVAAGAGSYAGNVVINPVPEPETYAMLLAGLGLLGFSARRRNKNS